MAHKLHSSPLWETDSPLCRRCQEFPESHDHVLNCSHHSQAFRAAKWSILANDLKKEHKTPDKVFFALEYGIHSWAHGNSDPIWPLPPPPIHTDSIATTSA